MKLWLIVPVKPFDQGKSRLSSTLDAEERGELMRRLLRHVLVTTQDTELFAGRVVISRDAAVLGYARALDAAILHEEGQELNQALAQSRQWVEGRGADAVLILPSDLPLLTVEDLYDLYEAAVTGVQVVVAPSQDGGTNALLLTIPSAFTFNFGADSFARHLAQAESRGMRVQVIYSSTLAQDVDFPEDLALLA